MRLPTFVYFVKPVGLDGPIKIGCSGDAMTRLKTLMVWSPFPLEILATAPGGFIEEGRLLRQFRAHRTHSEWFSPATEIIELIDEVKRTGCLPFPVQPINFADNGWRSNRRLLGLPGILRQHGITYSRFAEQAGVHVLTVSIWCRQAGSRTCGGRAVVALKELGVECSIDDLYHGPIPKIRVCRPRGLRIDRPARSDAEAA